MTKHPMMDHPAATRASISPYAENLAAGFRPGILMPAMVLVFAGGLILGGSTFKLVLRDAKAGTETCTMAGDRR